MNHGLRRIRRSRAHIGAALALVLVLASLLLVACGQAAASPPSGPGVAILEKARQAALKDCAFEVTFKTDDVNGTGTGTLTRQPLMAHLRLKVHSLGAVNAIEVITGPRDGYSRLQSDPMWTELASDFAIDSVAIPNDLLGYDKLRDVRLIGQETINGAATWHISAAVTLTSILYDDPVTTKLEGTVDLWIRQSDAFPVQLIQRVAGRYAVPVGGERGAPLTYSATYSFSKWNSGGVISEPPPDQVVVGG